MALPALLLLSALALSAAPVAEVDAAVLDPIDLHNCTSTSRCTGVYVDPGAPCVTVWHVDEEDDPSLDTC